MSTQTHHALDRLRQLGYKITKTRTAVLTAFAESQKPLSALELGHLLAQKRIHVNKTTIYRELTFLMTVNLIQKVHLAFPRTLYELTDLPHHHHVICVDCGSIEDVKCSREEQLLAEVQKQTSLKIHDHAIEFYGQCHNCL